MKTEISNDMVNFSKSSYKAWVRVTERMCSEKLPFSRAYFDDWCCTVSSSLGPGVRLHRRLDFGRLLEGRDDTSLEFFRRKDHLCDLRQKSRNLLESDPRPLYWSVAGPSDRSLILHFLFGIQYFGENHGPSSTTPSRKWPCWSPFCRRATKAVKRFLFSSRLAWISG